MKKSVFSLLTFICCSASAFPASQISHISILITICVQSKKFILPELIILKANPHAASNLTKNVETKVLAAVLQAAGKQKLIATDETQKPLPEYHNDNNTGRKALRPEI